jgi:aldose 1-epimerase
MKVEKITWLGEPAVYFAAGGYEALLVLSVGANVVKLNHIEKGLNLLRTPEKPEVFKASPETYGLPLLFPPNRIEDGTYTANGITYNLPINDTKFHNHIHGRLGHLPFNLLRSEVIEEAAAVEVEVNFISDDDNNIIFSYFPHEFECRLAYRLSEKGLEQRVTFINNSKAPMPLGVGFHTAFQVPFHPQSKREDYRLILSADERVELSCRSLPTGRMIPLNELEANYRENGMMPFSFPLDTPYTVKPVYVDGCEYHGAVLVDTSKNIRLFYEVGSDYKHWTVWNCGGGTNFVCPEPQTWVINAPNVNLPDEVTGFKLLPVGESWSEVCRIYVD